MIMFSKKLIWAMLLLFLFLSISLFLENLPQPKNKRVYTELLHYFPYKIKKELGGIDIVDTRTGKDLDIDNAKVYVVYDRYLKKWGQKHLKLQKDTLLILDDKGNLLKTMKLNKKEKEWVEKFFFSR